TTAMTPCCFVGSSDRASADSRFAQASSRFLALFLGGPGLLAAGSLGFAACNAAEGLGVVVAVVGVWLLTSLMVGVVVGVTDASSVGGRWRGDSRVLYHRN